MDELLELWRHAQRPVVFTGAGVSTLSGIPDFRGQDGIYKHLDVDRIFDIHSFLQDPSYYYLNSRDFIYNLHEREPSIVHRECARLEAAGRLRAVITQNIDMLHRKAGSRNVIELHGSPLEHVCVECGAEYSYTWISEQVQQDRVPRCTACGGVIKPGIVFFGEMLDETALGRAAAEAGAADLMIVLGSSLVVQPAASLPLLTLRGGGRLVIVNADRTPLDGLAACRCDDLAAVFARVAKEF